MQTPFRALPHGFVRQSNRSISKLTFQQLPMKQFLTVAIALLLGASIAIAQEAVSMASPKPSPSPSGTSEVERVVVSGGEIETSETDKAIPVTILSEDTL